MNELPNKYKKMVKCPSCEMNGKKEVLGEINEEGNFSIIRYHPGYTSKTVIMGSFSVICGGCGKIVFNKVSNDGTANIWV